MNTLTFDTHAFIKRLTASGMPEPQAEAVTTLMREASEAELSQLATKADLREAELRLEGRFDTRISEAKAEILKWMFGSMVAQTGLIIAAIKMMHG